MNTLTTNNYHTSLTIENDVYFLHLQTESGYAELLGKDLKELRVKLIELEIPQYIIDTTFDGLLSKPKTLVGKRLTLRQIEENLNEMFLGKKVIVHSHLSRWHDSDLIIDYEVDGDCRELYVLETYQTIDNEIIYYITES